MKNFGNVTYEELQEIGRKITAEIAQASLEADDLKLDLLLQEKCELNKQLARMRVEERMK